MIANSLSGSWAEITTGDISQIQVFGIKVVLLVVQVNIFVYVEL
jgi:hypothetical protein